MFYIINGRLEADVNKSVESHCVFLKSSHHRCNTLHSNAKISIRYSCASDFMSVHYRT